MAPIVSLIYHFYFAWLILIRLKKENRVIHFCSLPKLHTARQTVHTHLLRPESTLVSSMSDPIQ